MNGASVLDGLPLMVLRFEATALEGKRLPAYKGDALHKTLYAALAQEWCTHPGWAPGGVLGCDACARAGECLFDRLVNGRRDVAWSRAVGILMGGNRESALCVRDDGARWTYAPSGAAFHFEVTLIGAEAAARAIEVVQALAAWLPARGIGPQVEQELGYSRQPERLRAEVSAVHVLGYDLRAGAWRFDDLAAVSAHPTSGACSYALSLAEARHWVRMLGEPVRRASLRLLSPTYLQVRDQELDAPEMVALARALTRRLRILSEAWGAGEWPQGEYGPLLDAAEATRLDHHEACLLPDSHGKSTLVGPAWYSSESLAELLPLLCLGQWVNLGRGAVYGNGQYVIAELG